MSHDSAYSRLYRLINDSIRPYTEPEAVSLTKQQEKQLLASLSQVLRQIQLWIRDLDCDSDDESKTHSEDHHYLSKLMADLVFLLTVKSQYVQHLAGNILIVISEFLATSGSKWDLFIHSLCLCMELAFNNIFSLLSVPSKAEPGNSCFDLSSFVPIIRPILKDSGWSTLAGIIRVLRNILKCLKQDYDDEDNLAVVYLDSVHSCLSNVHWDSMDVNYGTWKSFPTVSLDIRSVSQEEPRIVFLGNFIQLLCSLVEQSSCVYDADRSLDKHPILCTITNLVPKLLCWCLGKEGEHVKACISQYFRHKLLVLMIRLSFQSRLDCCITVSWLQLLHNFFQELLWQPIAQVESAGDDCLEGSPFLMSVSDGEICNIHPRHVQRQAVFLLLRCSFILISLREDTNKHCACATVDSCLTFDSISDLDNCGKKRGLLELYKWIQGHLPVDTSLEYEMYMEKCINFSLSFLRLYMHEDDILFKVLLQLLIIPFCREHNFDKTKWTFQDVKEDIIFHISNLFNPIHLFHLFLAELRYDHQMLLDYLISKDTGSSCVEYLLRCLRLVCEHFHLFIEFSMGEKARNQSTDKRRRIPDSSNFPGRVPSATSKKFIQSLEDSDREYDYVHCITRGSHYKGAKDCLLSLKTSVGNLCQKNLFLYNPEALLKRFS
ncbi:hypothetical protein Ddye_010420 [Dipteronia dyeriana]|uniref:Protein Lines C-terminal domain-containing protein n=1 Tax=Dipteronia dyeriana TaxID=168575 RepID=A0AAD9XE72_9ROSI|nr:hypothetical protein Ddye_010420 [Dipteronia dyeriana]